MTDHSESSKSSPMRTKEQIYQRFEDRIVWECHLEANLAVYGSYYGPYRYETDLRKEFQGLRLVARDPSDGRNGLW